MLDSRWAALDRVSYIVQQDRKTAPTGRWRKIRSGGYPPFLVHSGCGGYFCGRPLSDPEVLAECLRFMKPAYRFFVRK